MHLSSKFSNVKTLQRFEFFFLLSQNEILFVFLYERCKVGKPLFQTEMANVTAWHEILSLIKVYKIYVVDFLFHFLTHTHNCVRKIRKMLQSEKRGSWKRVHLKVLPVAKYVEINKIDTILKFLISLTIKNMDKTRHRLHFSCNLSKINQVSFFFIFFFNDCNALSNLVKHTNCWHEKQRSYIIW